MYFTTSRFEIELENLDFRAKNIDFQDFILSSKISDFRALNPENLLEIELHRGYFFRRKNAEIPPIGGIFFGENTPIGGIFFAYLRAKIPRRGYFFLPVRRAMCVHKTGAYVPIRAVLVRN